MSAIHIEDISDLIAFGNGDYGYGTAAEPLEVYLDNDLDFATDDNEQWKYYNWGGCSGTFYCDFDGQNHSISNISYNGTANWGFFSGNVIGNIINLKILDLQVNTTGTAGGIIGQKTGNGNHVALRNCHVTGNITASVRAAGIVGNSVNNSDCTLDFCTFAGVIRGSIVSGLLNFQDVNTPNFLITCCGVRADLIASSQCSTLMYGSGYYSSSYPGFVRRSYFIGTLSGGQLFAGYNLSGRCTEDYAVIKSASTSVTCNSTLYDATVAAAAEITVNGGTGIATTDLQSKEYLRDTLHWAV